ncbi:MAG: anthranilate synthase component I family protein [Phycisphaerales bacterium]
MPTPARNLFRPLDWHPDPSDIPRAWPADQPLALLWSAAGGDPRWSRWSIFARPSGSLRTTTNRGVPATDECLGTHWSGPVDRAPDLSNPSDPLRSLADAIASTAPAPTVDRADPDPDRPPFVGGWIGALSYELGRFIEPAASRPQTPQSETSWPRMLLHRCPAAYVHDRVTDQWWIVGRPDDAAALPSLEQIDHAILAAHDREFRCELDETTLAPAARDRYTADAARVVEYIRAGDIFQANLAHTIGGAFHGSARALFSAMVEAAAPWFGAYLEDAPIARPANVLASISPELFLHLDPSDRTVTTRPIKGTRRGDDRPESLRASAKDAAELTMIVDLMRNDLGRVCEIGSIRVVHERSIERHATPRAAEGGLLHGVATVQGRLRPGLGVAELLGATFPAGSITGAPKVRAMQIIRELERNQRGAYCGSIGYLSDCGGACFNVGIRTTVIRRAGARPETGPIDHFDPGRWSYGAGAGIVADSTPQAEWEETLTKAAVITTLARTPNPAAQTPS